MACRPCCRSAPRFTGSATDRSQLSEGDVSHCAASAAVMRGAAEGESEPAAGLAGTDHLVDVAPGRPGGGAEVASRVVAREGVAGRGRIGRTLDLPAVDDADRLVGAHDPELRS